MASERSPTISVRGEFTASVLEKYGIKNSQVTGCPSLLWWTDRTANVSRRSAIPKRIAFHGTRSDTDQGLFSNPVYGIGLYVSRLAYRLGLDYIAQTELTDMLISDGDDERNPAANMNLLAKIYDDQIQPITQYVRKHVRYFVDVDHWIQSLREYDFVVGTRLHGTIASLLAGTPALLVTHDSRTREMADWACIPSLSSKDFIARDGNLISIYKDIDFQGFNERQNSYVAEFKQFFEINGIATNLKIA